MEKKQLLERSFWSIGVDKIPGRSPLRLRAHRWGIVASELRCGRYGRYPYTGRLGRIIACGPPEEIMKDETVAELYDFRRARFSSLLGGLELGEESGGSMFIVAGSGSGAGLYRALTKHDFGISTGFPVGEANCRNVELIREALRMGRVTYSLRKEEGEWLWGPLAPRLVYCEGLSSLLKRLREVECPQREGYM